MIDIPGAIVCPGLAQSAQPHDQCAGVPRHRRRLAAPRDRREQGLFDADADRQPGDDLSRDEELEAVVALGLLEVMKQRRDHAGRPVPPAPARDPRSRARWGLRLYGAPYLFSPAKTIGDRQVARCREGQLRGRDRARRLRARCSRSSTTAQRGRIRVILGPHAADSCAPDLLQRGRSHGARAQPARHDASGAEPGRGRSRPGGARHGPGRLHAERRPAARGRDLRARHASDRRRARRDRAMAGAAIANCASVFLRGGKSPNFERFKRHGVQVVIGTDAERMDMFSQLRATGFASKQVFGRATRRPRPTAAGGDDHRRRHPPPSRSRPHRKGQPPPIYRADRRHEAASAADPRSDPHPRLVRVGAPTSTRS